MTVLVLVNDEAGVSLGVPLEQVVHSVLDGIDAVLVVLDDHDKLRCESASQGCVGDEHDGRGVDDNQVVTLFEIVDQFGVVLGTEQFRRVARNVAAGEDVEVFDLGVVHDFV